ncbi:protein required for attachment to host cells [Natronocella acetinitrilica]|uniref:Protein required for attachment to host cells n=1 Tax=Natronocella acetinitrilica TaxID=414046 RepID=A0AAE3G774_9GAMM|nr:host attachment protein [Natronocella acetinitrilica]MCP1677085.1 protein required for attachment to host cells [Natronocella acetinitrilica]
MKTLWVVVADQSRARLFGVSNPLGTLQELEGLAAPELRLRDGELESDRRGHTVGAAGRGHSLEKRESLRERAAVRFAETIAERLTTGANDHAYTALILVAPPRFLGLLRDALPERLMRLVVHSLDKDLVTLPSADIRSHLPERL